MNINDIISFVQNRPQLMQDFVAIHEHIAEAAPAASHAIDQLSQRIDRCLSKSPPLSNEHKLLILATQFRIQELTQSALQEPSCKAAYDKALEKLAPTVSVVDTRAILRQLIDLYCTQSLKDLASDVTEASATAFVEHCLYNLQAASAREDTFINNLALRICRLVKQAICPQAASSTPDLLIEQIKSFFSVLCEIAKLRKQALIPAEKAPTEQTQPFQETMHLIPKFMGAGSADLIMQYQYDLSEALQGAHGDAKTLPPQWRVRLSLVTEITLHDIDMSYAKLEALAAHCTALKKITLTNVTMNGHRFYDMAAVAHFFPKEKEVEIVGAPCTEPDEWVSIVMELHESLGLTKEAVWGLYLQLHNQEHARHHESAHGEAREERLAGVEQQLLTRLAELVASLQTAGQ